jgi:hypothetical protein
MMLGLWAHVCRREHGVYTAIANGPQPSPTMLSHPQADMRRLPHRLSVAQAVIRLRMGNPS